MGTPLRHILIALGTAAGLLAGMVLALVLDRDESTYPQAPLPRVSQSDSAAATDAESAGRTALSRTDRQATQRRERRQSRSESAWVSPLVPAASVSVPPPWEYHPSESTQRSDFDAFLDDQIEEGTAALERQNEHIQANFAAGTAADLARSEEIRGQLHQAAATESMDWCSPSCPFDSPRAAYP